MRKPSVRTAGIAVLGAVALVAGACGGGDEGTVTTTLSDFEIVLAPSSVASGEVTFDITNNGPSTHEFVVFDTGLAEDQLPTDENGDVDEEGSPDITVVDEVEDIGSGADATLTVTLDAGTYVIVCNLPGHYAAGMHTTITVA
ncbi:MAG: hypothetical protein HY658_08335 [Actinobacteria bacterium]|nr:hypothetical protein [Actinomycetota bacterium]